MEVWNQIRLFFDNFKVKMRHVKYLVQQTFLDEEYIFTTETW